MQTLALKYRPKNYDELVGQEVVARSLSYALDNKRLGHAYLFSGLRGSGKTSSARIFAKAILCEQGPTSTPCEKCQNCIMANENRHIDIIEIDAASHRKIDDIRDLNEQVKYAPTIGRYKIFIIDEVHMLTKEAFNSFLKTLEEPPEYVKFILATTDPLKLPATILSRTQHFRFNPIAKSLIEKHLKNILVKEDIKFEDGAIDILSRSGSGSLRDTLTLLDQAIIFCEEDITQKKIADMLGILDPEKIDEILSVILKQDRIKMIELIKEFENQDTEIIIEELIENLKAKFLSRDSKFNILIYERFFRILSEAKSMLYVSPNNSFVLTIVLFMMMEAINLNDLEDVIEKVSESISKNDNKVEENSAKPIDKRIEKQEEKSKITTMSNSKYDNFLDAIYDRNYELGDCFKECVKFIKFEDNILFLSSNAIDKNKETLRNSSKVIMQILRTIFGANAKIKIEQLPEEEKSDIKIQESLTTEKDFQTNDIKFKLAFLKPTQKVDESDVLIKELDKLFGEHKIVD